MSTHHRQGAGHRTPIRTEGAPSWVQHGGPVGQIQALQLVGVGLSGAGGAVQRVVRSGAGIVW